jgi:hypothetical protein
LVGTEGHFFIIPVLISKSNLKNTAMKKAILVLATIAGFSFTACNNSSTDTTEKTADSVEATAEQQADQIEESAEAVSDSIKAAANATEDSAKAAAENIEKAGERKAEELKK